MKEILCLFLSLAGITTAGAQTFDFRWAGQISGTGAGGQSCSAHVTDSKGNIYLGGYFNGTADLDPGPGIHMATSTAGADIYIVKLDREGNMIWSSVLEGTAQQRLERLVLDKGQLLCIGTFRNGDVDFDPGAGTYKLSTAGTNVDGFVMKLDTMGKYKWAKAFQGGTTSVRGIVAGDLADIYVAGSFRNTVDLDPGPATVSVTVPATAEHSFLIRLDGNGDMVWYRVFEGGERTVIQGLCLDAAGKLYAAGHFTGTADFDPGAGVTTLSSGGSSVLNSFVLQMTRSGAFGWAKCLHDTLNCQARNILAGPAGSLYVCGMLQGRTDFDPGPGVYELGSKGSLDNYIAKLSDKGDFIWAHSFGGKQVDESAGATADKEGNVYVTGHFMDTVDFDPGPGVEQRVASYWDPFMIKLDSAGKFRWVQHIMGATTGFYGMGYEISMDDSGYICNSGTFNGKADFNTGPGLFEMSSPGSEGYVLKFRYCDLNTNVSLTGSVLSSASATGGYQWVHCPGYVLIPGATARTYTPAVSGSYAVIITNGTCMDTSGCMTVTITAGIGESTAAMGLVVAPNPSAGHVTLSLSNYVPGAQLLVYNFSGQQVMSRELQAVTNIEGLSRGFYILRVTNNGETACTKLWVR